MLDIVGVPATELTGPAFSADRARYSVMGFSVCLTAAFSFVALTAALTLATGSFSFLYLVASLVWALFIFNLDRWVVSTVDHETGWRRHLRVAGLTLCRLAIATLIGLSISIPIEMLIFHAEVGVEVDRLRGLEVEQAIAEIRKDPAYDPQTTPEATQLANALAALSQARRAVEAADVALDNELSGHAGSGDRGDGRRSRQRALDLSAAKEALRSIQSAAADVQGRFDSTAEALKTAQTAATQSVRDKAAQRPTGLIDRARALESLARDSAVNFVQWLVRGLILLIDISPVLLKLVSPKTVDEKIRPTRVKSAQRLSTLQIEADEAVRRALIRSRAAVQRYHLETAAGLAIERAARSNDIKVREVQFKHAKVIRERNLARPGHRMLGNPRIRLDEGRGLRLVGDRKPERGTPNRPGSAPPEPTQTWDGPAAPKHRQRRASTQRSTVALRPGSTRG